MSFEHSINFTRVQNVSIRRSSRCISGEDDLWSETSCTLLKLMLCSRLTYPLTYIRINQQSKNNAVELLYTRHRGPSCLSIIERCPYSEVVLCKLYVVVAAGSVLIREVAL